MFLIEWRKDRRFMGTEQIGFQTRDAAEEYLRRQYPHESDGPGVPTIYQMTFYTRAEIEELFPHQP